MSDPAQQQEPHYTGHRDRLRERFLKSPDALPDYELLELLLFMAIPRRDVKPIAKKLEAKFGSLNGVLNASLAQLQTVEGISETAAISLKTVQASAYRLLKQDVMDKPILNNWQRLTDYLKVTMQNETREHFRILFLNKKIR